MSSFVKQQFIEQVLSREGDRFLANQEAAMATLLNFHTHNIISRRSVHTETNQDLSGKLTVTHTVYERFLDMKAIQYGRKKVHMGYQIHNRFVWALYQSLAYRLMNDFTDQVAAEIRQKFSVE